MILKKLKLENIRSYKNQVVEFPMGRTLFEGDIGSGKSTILMAIEFALFGLGSEKPGSLLKTGESEGMVSIIFESGSKEYTVQRHLIKKANKYDQDKCALRFDGIIESYSASEIKEKVLEILDFNEPVNPKAKSLIYRYAIYTPQETIKEVITQDADDRLQTLRKAFRLEEYKVAAENAKTVSDKVSRRSRDFQINASDIPQIKERIESLASATRAKSREIEDLEAKQGEKKNLLNELKERNDMLQDERGVLKTETGKIETLSLMIGDKKKEVSISEKKIVELGSRISLNEHKITELKSLANPTIRSVEELQSEMKQKEEKERELRTVEAQIKSKLEDYETILEEKVCPTCDQEIEADSFSDKLKHKQKELDSVSERVEEYSKAVAKLKETAELKRNYDQTLVTLDELVVRQKEYSDDLTVHKSKFSEASKMIEEHSQELKTAKASVLKLNTVESEIAKLKRSVDVCVDELAELGKKIERNKADIRNWEDQSKELVKSLEIKLGQKEKAEKLNDYSMWLDDYFSPTVELIEKYVMTSINMDFDAQFQRWFGMLIDDPGKEAKIDEDFTPLIQQDGIDQDVSYLSGGERTSVALAYRLALNSIVRKVSTGMECNLLILDEPTDGFSKDQLGRVRDILDELNCPQIILVSHERELESFADQIFKVRKVNGISTITAGN